jgi:hypothetical protein
LRLKRGQSHCYVCDMARPPLAPEITRKTITLTADQWEMVAEFRHSRRINTEGDALRQLIDAGLKAEGVTKPPAAPKARKPGGKA